MRRARLVWAPGDRRHRQWRCEPSRIHPLDSKLARDLNIEKHVLFAGQQSAVETWLRRARVFVLTSDSEGLSLALMEAMMCGLPAVVSAVGDLGDLVEDGVNGYLVEHRSPQAFAEALRSLLTDPERFARFAAEARRAGAMNEPSAVTRRWDEILGDMSTSGDRRAR